MKKKVLRERRANNTAITAEKAIELINEAIDRLKEDVVVVPEVVEVKKTKKRATKKKEAE